MTPERAPSPATEAENNATPARRRWSPILAALLTVPILAAAGVALFSPAPRAPIAYCHAAAGFFSDLQDSARVHRDGGDDATVAGQLVDDSGKALPLAPAATRADWQVVHAGASRLQSTGATAVDAQWRSQGQVDTALHRLYDNYRRRCVTVTTIGNVPLDTAGLVGQPSPAAYCRRALTLFSDLVANTQGVDQFARDRLLSEAVRVAGIAPGPLAGDWAATVDGLRRLQKTGSAVDGTHPLEATNEPLNRLNDDYRARCPMPIAAPPSG